jgi:hypothetical protein
MDLTKIASIASGQWGMITTAQAASTGIEARSLSRLAGAGELERLSHGVYRLAGSPTGPHDDLRTAWIAIDPGKTAAERISAGPTEVVSHRSAAVLLELGDLDADLLEFTTVTRRQTRRSDVVLRRGTLQPDAWTLIDGLPATTPLRTIADLSAARIDRGHLAGAVRDAMALHGVPAAPIAAVLSGHARAYGAPAGAGGQLVGILLTEAGVPQSAIDLAARGGPAVQQALADRLIAGGTFHDIVGAAVRRTLEDLDVPVGRDAAVDR